MQPAKLLNKHFVLLFQGQLVSQIGSSVYMIALVFWVKHATDSATLIGLLAMVATIPGILLGPFGGAVADHFSRKRIIVIGDILNGVFISSIAFVMFTSPEQTELIITLMFIEAVIGGTIMAVFRPAISASIPDIVPSKSIDAANGMMQGSFQVSMLIGQAAGGYLFRVLGAPLVMLIDGITYLFSALSESFITIPQKTAESIESWAEAYQKFKGDTIEGFRYVQQSKGLRSLFFVVALMNFFAAPFGVLLAFFVEDTLQSTSDWYGYIIAGLAFGTIVGSILAGALRISPAHKGKAAVVALVLLALGFVAFAYSTTPLIALAILGFVGVCSGLVNVLIAGVMQLSTPSEIRGRVFGLLGTLSGGLVPISLGLAGVIADLVDRNIPLMYVVSGLCILAVLPLLAFSRPFHELMAYEAPPEDEPEVAAEP
jgi:MFS family permease